MDDIGRSYLTLALHLNRHFAGFVDAYFGPPELEAKVEAGQPRSLDLLADDVKRLQEAIQSSPYDEQRKDYLARQTGAMGCMVRKLKGEELCFVEEVELCFDITPEMVDESVFEGVHAELDRLLPGRGSLLDRLTAWKQSVELEIDRILPACDLVLEEVQERTLALFDLPPGEEVSLRLVENEPWTAYNWYLGEYRSRIDLNTDVPIRGDQVLPVLTHEAYPGHHTEHVSKEQYLYRQAGRVEHAIQLTLAPEAVISEGLAESARPLLLGEVDLADFLSEQLFPLAGLANVDLEQLIGLTLALDEFLAVTCNAALLLHRDNRPLAEVQEYVVHYAKRRPEEVAQSLQFVQDPLCRAYIFNYSMGRELVAPLLEGPDRVANFARLLSEPFTPSQVRQWLAEDEIGREP
jgi:hypothetical protein